MVESRTVGVFNAAGPDYGQSMQEMLLGIRAATTAGARLHWVSTAFLKEQKVEAWSDMPVWVPSEPDTVGFSRRSVKRAMAAGLVFRPLAQTTLDTLAWFTTLRPSGRRSCARASRRSARRQCWRRGKRRSRGCTTTSTCCVVPMPPSSVTNNRRHREYAERACQPGPGRLNRSLGTPCNADGPDANVAE